MPAGLATEPALRRRGSEDAKIVLAVVAAPHGAEPTGGGAPPGGKKDACQEHRQPPAIAGEQPGRQPIPPLRPFVGTLLIRFRHPWLSCRSRPGKAKLDRRTFFIARRVLLHAGYGRMFSASAEPNQLDKYWNCLAVARVPTSTPTTRPHGTGCLTARLSGQLRCRCAARRTKNPHSSAEQ